MSTDIEVIEGWSKTGGEAGYGPWRAKSYYTVLFKGTDKSKNCAAWINRHLPGTGVTPSGSFPKYGEVHPQDQFHYVTGWDLIRRGLYIWDVIVNYETPVMGRGSAVDPLSEEPSIRWYSSKTGEELTFDCYGRFISNSAGDIFDPPVQLDHTDLVCTVTNNIATLLIQEWEPYFDTVNDSTFLGHPAKTVAFDGVEIDNYVKSGSTEYWKVTAKFNVALAKVPNTQSCEWWLGTDDSWIPVSAGSYIGHRVVRANVGYNALVEYKKNTGEFVTVPIYLDKDEGPNVKQIGDRPQTAVPLDVSGMPIPRKIGNGNGRVRDAVMVMFDVKKAVDYSFLATTLRLP